jgi:hypothetical protein
MGESGMVILGRFFQTLLPADDLHKNIVKNVLCRISVTNALLNKRKKLRLILGINMFSVLHGDLLTFLHSAALFSLARGHAARPG